MKQIIQSLSTGEIEVVACPCPRARRGHLLIQTDVSLISAGTERMLLQFGKANLLQKARQQPDRVREVLEKVRTDGLLSTIGAVQSKLNQSIPLGYCNAGTVLEVGGDVSHIQVGDRVVSNGHHAEVVCVPKNLCAKIPREVSSRSAGFAVVGAIGLQGVRLAEPTLGESFVVTGLGLIGLLTVQLLKAHGCRVLGIDFDERRLALARRFGAETVNPSKGEDPIAVARAFARGRGVDGVLLTAATHSNEPVHQAAQMCRQRGRIVLVGVVGLELSRSDFYEKELSFRVSCSYGPGRYDPAFEQQGVDYPIGFVRWTEQRNFEAVLDMMSDGRLQVESLITHEFELGEAQRAYEVIGGKGHSLGVLLEYAASKAGTAEVRRPNVTVMAAADVVERPAASIAVIGAGNYASRVLLPAFQRQSAQIKLISSQGGLTAVQAARKFAIGEASTQSAVEILTRHDIDAVVIATRHDSHAEYVCDGLKAGKHIFVEKPLAITQEGLDRIVSAYDSAARTPIVMVGFNRRFAPLVRKMHSLLSAQSAPKSFVMTVNAGHLDPENWNHDRAIGGGRIVGEACHFIDLLRFLSGHRIISLQATMMGRNAHEIRDDKVTFTLSFADGSFGTVHYLANGHRSLPKERLEVFCANRVLLLDNFRTLRGFGWPGCRKTRLWRQDKGHAATVQAFLQAMAGQRPSPIPFDELVEVTQVSLDVLCAAEQQSVVRYDGDRDVVQRDHRAFAKSA